MARKTTHDGFESDIILETNLNTTTADQFVYPVDSSARSIANNGIFQDGGITEVYELQTSLSGLYSYTGTDGKLITISSGVTGKTNDISVDGNYVGSVSNYAISKRLRIQGVADVALTADSTYMTIAVKVTDSSTISAVLTEYSLSQAQLNQRTISFTNQSSAAGSAIQWAIVKYLSMHYSDSLELTGYDGSGTVYRLQEAAPSTAAASVSAYAASIFCWRFQGSNGYFIGSGPPYAQNPAYVDSTFASATGVEAKYGIPVKVGSYSAILLTQPPSAVSTNLQMIGYVGYDSGGTFHSTAQWASAGTGSTPSAITGTVSFGYAEADFTASGNAYWAIYPAPTGVRTMANYYNGTGTTPFTALCYSYGMLSNTYLETSTQPFSFKSLLSPNLELPTAISVASAVTGKTNELGSLITNVGEWDTNYIPQIEGFNTILYRYAGTHYIVKVEDSQTAAPSIGPIQEISRGLYKINTISGFNILDADAGILCVGSADYGGALQVVGNTYQYTNPVATI